MGQKHKKGAPKLCLIASSGGHFEQLLMLRPLLEKYEGFFVTEKTAYAVEAEGQRILFLKQVNRRERGMLLKMLGNAFRSAAILLRERPDVVITTGALSVIPLCLLAKLFGKKLIFIESFAKVTTPTETGKLLYRFADRFYVQWESMLAVYPNAVYKGGIY